MGVLVTVTKRLIKDLKDLDIKERVETIQMTALSARILRVQKTCCHSNSNGRPQLTLM